MTPTDLRDLLLPHARAAVRSSDKFGRGPVGFVRKSILQAALPLVLKIGIEVSVGLLAPWAMPLVEALLNALAPGAGGAATGGDPGGDHPANGAAPLGLGPADVVKLGVVRDVLAAGKAREGFEPESLAGLTEAP